MLTRHAILTGDAARLGAIPDASVALVVTSPPYPMIEMWDESFSRQDEDIRVALAEKDGWRAYRSMHAVLDRAWREIYRVLAPGGIACINIGDATRTIDGEFALYPSHARILSALVELGLTPLPEILWRKQTNAPNKFMGSGMLPAGAYVTLEHEHILIVRKDGKRLFGSEEAKGERRRSAFFWEERNQWFSDVWFDLKGAGQTLASSDLRERSGAFPFELAYRLIHMFSVQGDTVLDPFVGTGTTLLAAMASARNGIGVELEVELARAISKQARRVPAIARERIEARLEAHRVFVRERHAKVGRFGYRNELYGFPVVTRQETDLIFPVPTGVEETSETELVVSYDLSPTDESVEWEWFFSGAEPPARKARAKTRRPAARSALIQKDLFGESP